MAIEEVFVHERALVESSQIGPGTRVWAFAHVMKGAVVGSGCNLCDHCFVESGAVLGDRVTVKNGVAIWDGVDVEDDVFLGPNAVLTNVMNPRVGFKKNSDELLNTRIGRGATVGANATVICGHDIGDYAFIGAGAVVSADVPAHAKVVGNPSRQIGWACRCGESLDPAKLSCTVCERKYEKEGDGLKLL